MTFNSCVENGTNVTPFDPTTMSPFRYYILGEGQFGKNDASITGVDWNDKFKTDIYYTQNGKKLGDNANDMVLGTQGCLYVAVTESRYVAKLDFSGKELARYTPADEKFKPRSLYNQGGKLYVSEYGGRVERLDTATLRPIDSVEVGEFPEQMSSNGSYMLVCNSDYNMSGYNSVSVINLAKFAVESTIELPYTNPQRILLHDGIFFCITTGYDENWNTQNHVISINPKTWKVAEISDEGNLMASYLQSSTSSASTKLLVANVATDWTTMKTKTTFKYYNTGTGKFDTCDQRFAQELASRQVYNIQSIYLNNVFWYAILVNNTDAAGQPSGSTLYIVNQYSGEIVFRIENTGCIFASRVVTLGI